MRGIPFGLGQLSASEKSDILNQHKKIYDGYQTMEPKVSNTQPLYVYDDISDKNGITVNNKGEVKKYSNMGINEQWQAAVGDAVVGYVADKAADKIVDTVSNVFNGETNEVCDDCGSTEMDEDNMCECGGMLDEGVCNECGSSYMKEETGHLDDIYNVEDFDPTAGFDYIEGSSNDVDTFEGMHKKLYKEHDVNMEFYDDEVPSFNSNGEFLGMTKRSGDMETSDFENPDNENDGFEDLNASEVTDEIEEQGGNTDDMDVDDVDSAFNFDSKGPDEFGDDTYSVSANDMDLDKSKEWGSFDFDSEGPGMGSSYPVNEYDDEVEDDVKTFEPMESAWADKELEEIDVSGVQGIYGDMKRAYDFDSKGPGEGGPYQHSQYNEGEAYEQEFRPNVDLGKSFKKFKNKMVDKDLEDGELDVDFDKFDPREKSWEEITDYTGEDEFGGVDEDIKESLIIQKNKIMEMMNRMKVIK